MSELFAGVPVTRLEQALPWWERLTERPPDFFPNDNEAVWQLGGGWVYLVGDSERAGNALLTVLVDDLDSHVAELSERGLETEPIDTIPNVVRKAATADPDGNWVTFGEGLGDGA